eukprot:gnl/TRDRNA2_/TRDRNA2_126820_c0_seq1.p1 gnl/TRDRNA2_/TRDRNA2_126820_c0~~gnl/TRDRNA2_/TRDRNA2_126820_c0_seq1.p1  ORF type:complete len:474 (-),score=75.81 gnl/TRDRNA2_/TRDRNA2_126820_c0_seq1:91-1512(-)
MREQLCGVAERCNDVRAEAPTLRTAVKANLPRCTMKAALAISCAAGVLFTLQLAWSSGAAHLGRPLRYKQRRAQDLSRTVLGRPSQLTLGSPSALLRSVLPLRGFSSPEAQRGVQKLPGRHVQGRRSTTLVRASTEEEAPGLYQRAKNFVAEVMGPELEVDNATEAVSLRAALEAENKNLSLIWKASGAYNDMRWKRMTSSKAVKKNAGTAIGVVNGAIVLVVLRTLVPRILAAEGAGDLSELAQMFGLPPKEELVRQLKELQEIPFLLKVAVYFGVFSVEKILMLSEFIPATVVFPALAPALFENFALGCLVSVGASTAAAGINFKIGENFLSERVENYQWQEQPKIKDSDWYKKIQVAVKKDPFKIAFLLRLAPILPIPFDAHWYVCGVTRMDFAKFMAAYALGTLKPVFIDAYFGSLLTDPIVDPSVQQQTKVVLFLEIVLILVASFVATNLATSTLADVLADDVNSTAS